MWLFLVLLAVPVVEIALFVQIGGWLTLWPTLAIVVATGLAGAALIRRQGLRTLADLRAAAEGLRDPLGPLAHGLAIMVAGLLLLTPGFMTDTLGLLLLVPPLRAALLRRAAQAVAARVVTVRATGARPAREDVIDGEYVDITAPPPRAGTTPARSRH